MSNEPNQDTKRPTPAEKVASTDLDFIADTKAAFLEEKSYLTSLLLLSVMGIVAAFCFWAPQSRVDEATKGQGKVIPSDALQIVQSLEGGIVSDLLVAEGQIVDQGQVLLRIDDTAFSATHRESVAQRDSLEATIARLDAEADEADNIRFPERIIESRPDLVASEQRLFDIRRQNLRETEDHLSKSMALRDEELRITRPLADKGIVSQVELLRLETALNDIKGELASKRSNYMKEVLTLRAEAEGKLHQIEQSSMAYEDRVNRATINSPVYGVVNKIHHQTRGGVIRPGEPIIEIVPLESTLLVEANILPANIGFIRPGQEATVKLTAYDYSIFGGLEGTVERISADTFTNERGESFYKILVRTGGRSLKTNDQELAIKPGMQVEVDILTGNKSVLSYLFKPLLRAKMNAFTEK